MLGERYILAVIEGKKRAPFLCSFLLLCSQFFKAGSFLHHLAFESGLVKKKKVGLPVVSVGNIIAGGSGKTPFVEKIGKELSSLAHLAILSRGYRAKRRGGVLSADEPLLLAESLPEAQIWIGKNRYRSAKKARAGGAEVLLLDDGMQYLRLHRDFEIVVLHAEDLYGRGFYLPRGYLRDSPRRLQKADLLVLHHVKGDAHFANLSQELLCYTGAPLVGTRMLPRSIVDEKGGRQRSLIGRRVGVFCALGKPSSFLETIREFGGEIIDTLLLPDHRSPGKKSLHQFIARCAERGCDLILSSKKDWVKLPQKDSFPLPLAYLEAECTVLYGKEHYHSLLDRIEKRIKEGERS